MAALALVGGGVISLVLAGPVAAMLTPALSKKNYRGENIPTAMGLVLLMAVLGSLGLLAAWDSAGGREFGLTAFWLTLVSLAGLVDDAAGNDHSRGFRGHFSALFQGQLTTGMAKVLIVSGGSLAVVHWPLGWVVFLELGILVLAVNLFNQLDLRPGRALKSFIIVSAVLALGGSQTAAAGFGGVAGLLAGDLRAKYMLGDTGSNLLGAILGLALITVLAEVWLIPALALLILANALGEFLSFSRIIAGSRVLTWLDKLGSRQAGE